MAMQWRNISHRIPQQDFIRETRWTNIPTLKTQLRCPHFISSKSSTESISSSSSWTSSQESLNVYATSPEFPRVIGCKAQDRLRRIRESFNHKQSLKMEVDEKMESNSEIRPMKQMEEAKSISHCYSPMAIDSDVENSDMMNTIHSVSLRLKRFRQALSNPIANDQSQDNACKLPPSRAWNCEIPTSNKYRHPNSKERINNNNFQSLANYQSTPRWMFTSLTAKPLRRPRISQ